MYEELNTGQPAVQEVMVAASVNQALVDSICFQKKGGEKKVKKTTAAKSSKMSGRILRNGSINFASYKVQS